MIRVRVGTTTLTVCVAQIRLSTPTMPKAVHDNANGQSALTEKVQLLFDHKTDESKLVGLLLATRLDDDAAFLQLITSHITADWCAWILERQEVVCLLYTSPSPRDLSTSRMPSSA